MEYEQTALPAKFFDRPVQEVARALIGVWLVVERRGSRVGGPLVETEAYGPEDPASHSFRGQTRRNWVMFGPGGHLYVYKIYGIHWCMNVSTGPRDHGAAVLLRAIEPRLGLATMRKRRRDAPDRDLARGPGRLTEALGVTDREQDHNLQCAPLTLHRGLLPAADVIATPRIGIRKATETLWRFALNENRYVSGPSRLRRKGPFP